MHDPGAEPVTPEETHVGGDPVSDPESETEPDSEAESEDED